MILKPIFLTMLMLSILIAISCNSWFNLWMMIELNMISFIPLMLNKNNNKFFMIHMFKYFFIQSFSSNLMFFSMFMNMMSNNSFMNLTIMNFFMISMFIKLSIFPFHLWYIYLMNFLTWMNCFILSIIQKIIPIYIMMINYWNFKLMILMLLINSTVSSILGLNQSYLKMMMAYSSMGHISWMMFISMINESMLFKYLILYIFINMKIMYIFNMFNMKMMNEIYIFNGPMLMKMLLMMNILSLGGLPPMMGFLMKWFSLNFLIYWKLNFMFIMIILLINSTMTLFYYIQIFIPSLFMFYKSNKFFYKNLNLKIKIISIIFMSLTFLLMNNIFN